jgi:hypothetical protein
MSVYIYDHLGRRKNEDENKNEEDMSRFMW